MWSPGGVLLKHLLDWWQVRFVDECNRKAFTAMKSDLPEIHPEYWDAVSFVHKSLKSAFCGFCIMMTL